MPMLGRLTVLPVAGIVPWGVTTAPPGRSPARGPRAAPPAVDRVGARSSTLRALRRRAKPAFPRCLGGSGGRLASHRLVDHMPVMPLRLLGEVLQRPAVFLIHLRAVGGPLVCLFALEDNAHPDLIWVGHALEDRVVDPTLGRRSLEPLHLGDKLIQAAWLDAVLRDGSVHFGALLRQVDGQILSMAQPSSPGNR